MDDKKTFAVPIPRREAGPEKEAATPARSGTGSQVSLAGAEFVEIEYEFNPGGKTERRPFFPAAPAQPIAPRTVDPIRQRFYDMRSLATGNPFARNDAGLFYKQARFMEDFSDDYQDSAQFSMYYPYYQHMGYEQLRTYFTWRTRVRRGEIQPASPSYVFLFIYELLSGIGAESPIDGLDRLMAVWNGYREHEPSLDEYLPRWLKDYHIYYELPHSFADFVGEYGLRRHYRELFLFEADAESSLTLWNGISGYDITKSKFYGAGNETLLRDCFYRVLGGVRELCARHNIGIEALFSLGVNASYNWYPFQRALFFNWRSQPDRTVEMPGGEKYFCKDNFWTASTVIHDTGRGELAGYLIKKTEACLRRAVKYKFKITANSGMFVNNLKRLGIPFAELDKAVEDAVADFHRNATRTIVAVDHERLARIRREALGTQDKLIVPDEPEAAAPQNMPVLPKPPAKPSSGWDALRDALTETERKALFLALRGDGSIKAFADQNGVMLEVLADGINEKATDHIGDGILDNDMTVYDEYREKVAEMGA